ncbi:Rab geranylgeranyltransferase [Tieghemiomyces parasiticus]|uniref:Geranylgeranyl transferase type-2 subunit alpha n=1 Tax=Tieghemiomyces parasiticus TaxID=78921 RepID=A0A9W8AJY7_9FUNG|nr:Rab geranylgeranyltransferase [Tieghemiomyces parasiticus]
MVRTPPFTARTHSHGVRRVKDPKEVQLLKKQKEAKLIESYRSVNQAVFTKRDDHALDDEAFELTTQQLRLNPDLYTVWNYRRKILLSRFFNMSDDEKIRACQAELAFFMECIRFNPKSYWIWNHRFWTLNVTPVPDWSAELKLVGKMLGLDARNFHGWNYRRYVVNRLREAQPDRVLTINLEELEYTTTHIMTDFSNFSAWHNRLKLLEAILPHKTIAERRKLIEDDFELVQGALYTEPRDECGWLHWRWLVKQAIDNGAEQPDALLEAQLGIIQELYELAPDVKLILRNILYIYKVKQNTVGLTDADRTAAAEHAAALTELDPLRVGLTDEWWR